jgi:CRISPR-associated protein Csx14
LTVEQEIEKTVMQGYKGYKHTLVATLGGQPQIVTFTLDLLLKRGIPISEVVVVHPAASPRIQQSLERLNAEFA